MKTSARNHLVGTVSAVTAGAVNDVVEISLRGGQRLQAGAVNAELVIDIGGGVSIVAIVTQESASSLGLAPGTSATAIFKASSVIVGVPR